MLKRAIPIFAVAGLCIAAALEITHPPTPRLIYNKSQSAPVGWYRLDPNGVILRDVKVAAFAPTDARKLAEERGYLPANIPLIKTVWAVGGDRICAINGVISAPNRPDILASREDSLGRRMPELKDCFTLKEGQVFLISTDVQTSWDSRYFGPVELEDVLGTVHYLGKQHGSLGAAGGGSRGLGVEGKIKAGSAPLWLSPCLHIFFGSAPKIEGSTPFPTQSSMVFEVSGGAPYPESHANPHWPE